MKQQPESKKVAAIEPVPKTSVSGPTSEDSSSVNGAAEMPGPVVLNPSEECGRPLTRSSTQLSRSAPADRAGIMFAPNLTSLLTGLLEAPGGAQADRDRRDLDEAVHRVLMIGLVMSAALMVTGVVLDIVSHHELPTSVPDFRDILARVAARRPSGFLYLGLLVLVATPIMRVVGSIFAFAREGDWRYVVVTFLVLVVVSISLMFGKG